MSFIASVIYQVNDLNGTINFFIDHLGFRQRQVIENGVLIENGFISLTLIESNKTGSENEGIKLEMLTHNIQEEARKLLKIGGVELIPQKENINKERFETKLQCPYGVTIMLVQEINDDEFGFMPTLPASLVWGEDAEHCVQQLLQQIPFETRDLVRSDLTYEAERVAKKRGSLIVYLDDALHALEYLKAYMPKEKILSILRDFGIDARRYLKGK